MKKRFLHRTLKRFANPKGFTMVELVIIIVIVGIAFPTLISPFLTSVRGFVQVENFSKMSYLASQHMETALSEEDNSDWWTALPSSTSPPPVNLNGVDFTLSRTLTYVDSSLNPSATPTSYMLIKITVTDEDGNEVNLEGLITEGA